MSDVAITVEGLGKAYHIGLREENPDSLVSAVGSWLKRPLRNFKHLGRLDTNKAMKGNADDIFWALRDVSFEVKRGEVVGIIGRNGAGKSTLLKILSRITEPTTGRVVIRGRVSSLLEVGTGFHPELSGRENVYMNGTILGMTKREIAGKFDEIVEFSGVEKFLDTPVKRYSSGMKVRLAFAVAAHLEPEILIIDEVLAVGDAEFQKKCLGKMQGVAAEGRTVLFVSHNMPAVNNLCTRAIVISEGMVVLNGPTKSAINHYMQFTLPSSGVQHFEDHDGGRTGTGDIQFQSAEVESLGGIGVTTLPMGAGFRVQMVIKSSISAKDVVIAVGLFDERGTRLCGFNSGHTAQWKLSFDEGEISTCYCEVKQVNLGPNRYRLSLQLKQSIGTHLYDSIEDALTFEVSPADVFKTGHIPKGQNAIFLRPNWFKGSGSDNEALNDLR